MESPSGIVPRDEAAEIETRIARLVRRAGVITILVWVVAIPGLLGLRGVFMILGEARESRDVTMSEAERDKVAEERLLRFGIALGLAVLPFGLYWFRNLTIEEVNQLVLKVEKLRVGPEIVQQPIVTVVPDAPISPSADCTHATTVAQVIDAEASPTLAARRAGPVRRFVVGFLIALVVVVCIIGGCILWVIATS